MRKAARPPDIMRKKVDPEDAPVDPEQDSTEQPPEPYLEFLTRTAPRGWSYDSPHFHEIAELIDDTIAGEIDRARVHMPPRHGKSQSITVKLPVYMLLHRPGIRVLITGYNERFARKLSRQVKILAQLCGVTISADKAATDEWYTTDGSMVMARGVGSPPTGEGFDLIIIDDPIRSREDAESAVYREKLDDWYTDDLLTRLQPKGAIVGVWTRWHEDDLAGRLQAVEDEGGDPWTKLVLRAIAEDDCPLGREPGEALWPEQWPLDTLNRRRMAMRKRMGERSWQALFQQNPTPPEGSIFNVSLIQIADAAPRIVARFRRWDVANSVDGDWTVGILLGIDDQGFLWVLDVVRFRSESENRDARMRAVAMQDGLSVTIGVPTDPGAAGKSQVAYWIRHTFAGFTVVDRAESGSKETRAGPVAAQVNAGNVRMVRADWNHDFIAELRSFPGKHDDQVDALSDGYLMAVGSSTALEFY